MRALPSRKHERCRVASTDARPSAGARSSSERARLDQGSVHRARDARVCPEAWIPIFLANDKRGHGSYLWDDNAGEMGPVAVAWFNWMLRGDQGPTGKGMFVGDDCGMCKKKPEVFTLCTYTNAGGVVVMIVWAVARARNRHAYDPGSASDRCPRRPSPAVPGRPRTASV